MEVGADAGAVAEVWLVDVVSSVLAVKDMDGEGVSKLVDVVVPGTLPECWTWADVSTTVCERVVPSAKVDEEASKLPDDPVTAVELLQDWL